MFTKIKYYMYEIQFKAYGKLAEIYFKKSDEDPEHFNKWQTKGWECIIKREYLLAEMMEMKGLI